MRLAQRPNASSGCGDQYILRIRAYYCGSILSVLPGHCILAPAAQMWALCHAHSPDFLAALTIVFQCFLTNLTMAPTSPSFWISPWGVGLASIDRIAYLRFKRVVSVRELFEVFTPSGALGNQIK